MRKIASVVLFAAMLLVALTIVSAAPRASAACSSPGVHQLCVAGATFNSSNGTYNYTVQGCGFALGKRAYIQVNGLGTHSVPLDGQGCINTIVTNVANNSCIAAYQNGAKNTVVMTVSGGVKTSNGPC